MNSNEGFPTDGEAFQNAPRYRYRKLESDRHIRLLHVSSSDLGPVFEIVHADLDRPLHFEALSYVWGDDSRPLQLPIANRAGYVSLTESLDQALQYLPGLLGTGYIWIDQICINQDDPKERGQQVSLMGEIFRAAKMVFVWLGPADQRLLPILRVLKLAEEKDHSEQTEEELWRIFGNMANDAASVAEELSGARQIFAHSWFTRSWVFQEFALARDLQIAIGPHCFHWKSLILIATLGRHQHGPNVNACVTQVAGRSYWQKELHQDVSPEDRAFQFCRLLTMIGRRLHATDPRDKVVAYFGFWKPQNFETESVYTTETGEVYTRLSRCIIEESASLDILGAGRGVDTPRSPDYEHSSLSLPSWVPDWSGVSSYDLSPILTRLLPETKWDASQRRLHQCPFQSSDSLRLKCRGKMICSAEYTSTYVLPAMDVRNERPEIIKQWRAFRNHVENEAFLEGVDETELVETICRAILCGNELDQSPSYIVKDLSREAGEDEDGKRSGAAKFREALNFAWGRKIVKTSTGKVGLVPHTCMPGDVIAILHGSRVPLLLRQVEDSSNYQLVGDCYVDGLMFGEAVSWEEHEAESFTLV